MHEHAEQGGQAVGRQFHDKGGRLALDDGGAQQTGHQQGEDPAGQHDQHHHRRGLVAKEGRGQQQEHGQLGAAAHVRQGQQGRQLFFGAAQGTRGHGAGDGAAARDTARDDIRHDRGTVQAESAEDAVHHIGDARHVAAVFQEGDESEHDDDEGREAEHAAHAADDAVHHQGLQLSFRDDAGKEFTQRGAAVFHPALGIGPDLDGHIEQAIQHGQHDERTEKGIGQHLVQLVGKSQTILASVLAHHAVTQQPSDIAVAGIRDVGFHGDVVRGADVLGHFTAHGIQLRRGLAAGLMHFLADLGVTFHELHGDPVGRVLLQQAFAPDDPAPGPQAFVDIRTIVEFQHPALASAGQTRRLTEGLLQTLTGTGHGGHHRDAHHPGQALHVDMHTGLAGFIHHIADQHHRQAHLHHLHGQQQVALQGRGVHHIDDGLNVPAAQLGTGHQLFHGVGGQRIGPGQVHQGDVDVAVAHMTFLAVHRDAGVIAHMLPCACIGIEHRGFTTVGIACQSDPQRSCGHFSLTTIKPGFSTHSKNSSLRPCVTHGKKK